jgi:hypothetical protein
MQHLGALRPRDRLFVLLINLVKGHAYQFHRGFRVGFEDGILRQTVPEDAAQSPMFVGTALSLQRTDVSQLLEESRQDPQRAVFEILGCAVIHPLSLRHKIA